MPRNDKALVLLLNFSRSLGLGGVNNAAKGEVAARSQPRPRVDEDDRDRPNWTYYIGGGDARTRTSGLLITFSCALLTGTGITL